MEQIISAGLEELGLSGHVPQDAPSKLAQYGRLLLEKNQDMNLTAIREPAAVAQLHMLDCAALLKYCDFQNKTTLDVTLLDSLNKRLDWLGKLSETLGLEGICTVHARAEEQAFVKGFRDSFDFAAARAVADLRILCELCLPYVKAGGQFLAMKSTGSGQEATAAAHAIRLLGGRVTASEDYVIPGAGVTHRLLIVKKAAPTLKGYPRRWAKIQKEPL